MTNLARISENVKPGAFFITFTSDLPSTRWEVLEGKRFEMSWGPATVYIHRKKEEISEYHQVD